MITFLLNEEIFRLCPVDAWLTDGETLTGEPTVTVTNASGEPQPTMVSDVALYGLTGVRYKIKALAVGFYAVRIDAVTSNGQKPAHRYPMEVKA